MKIKFIRRGHRACLGDRPGFAESKNSVSSVYSALKYTNYEAKA